MTPCHTLPNGTLKVTFSAARSVSHETYEGWLGFFGFFAGAASRLCQSTAGLNNRR